MSRFKLTPDPPARMVFAEPPEGRRLLEVCLEVAPPIANRSHTLIGPVQLLGRAALPSLALLTALVVGAILIVLTDFEHLRHLGSDPAGALGGALGEVVEGYGAILSGAIGDPARILTAVQGGNPADIAGAIRPLTETLLIATPFIFVSLANAFPA